MTRETKVGLLIGMGVILLIGIIVSDTLSVARQGPADLADHGDRSQDSIFRPGPGDGLAQRDASRDGREGRQQRRDPLPASEDAQSRRRHAEAEPTETDTRASRSQRQLPTALALDNGRSGQADQRTTEAPAQQRRDVPTIDLSHEWMFHTPEREEPDERPAERPTERREAEATPQREPERAQREREPITRPDATADASTDDRQATHEVQRGETLSDIARNYYGSVRHWRRLAEANSDTVGPEGQVSAGTKLVIPDAAAMELREAGFEPAGTERVVRIDDAPRSQAVREVEVASGDTLSGLAARHLGSANRWRDLLEANRDRLDSETSLRVGMTLRLPDGSSTSGDSGGSGSAGRSYTVRSGDSLSRIAQRELGDSDRWREVYDANRDTLASPDSLRVGQTLRLP